MATVPVSNYISHANECVQIKLLTSPDEMITELRACPQLNSTIPFNLHPDRPLNRVLTFQPDFSCQVFGPGERIYGYKDLSVQLYYSSATLHIFMHAQYSSTIHEDDHSALVKGVRVDDIGHFITTRYFTKVHQNYREYEKLLADNRRFIPFGRLLEQFCLDEHCRDHSDHRGCSSSHRGFSVFKLDNTNPQFVGYLERIQSFQLWLNESVSYINPTNDRWDFYVVYEIGPPPADSEPDQQQPVFVFAGYCAVYRFNSYPDNVRACISQYFVLPPYAKTSLGLHLLGHIYQQYRNEKTFDITFEEPSDQLKLWRDVLDCSLCAGLASYVPERLRSGWTKDMAKEARDQYKISGKQARRVYEILRLKETDVTNLDEYRAYRADIEQRLERKYAKELRRMARYEDVSEHEAVPEGYETEPKVDRYQLSREYENVVEKYHSILVAMHC